MNSTITALCVVVVGALAFLFERPLWSSPGGDEDASARSLEGTWRVEVTLQDCESGAPSPPFRSLLTFARGGTLIGATANAAFLAGQRSPDHGVWRSDGGRRFRAVDEALILFDSPPHPPFPAFQTGMQRINQTIELTSDDEFASVATTSFFDVGGKLLTKGCATAIGSRLK